LSPLRIHSILEPGDWKRAAVDRITLDYDDRHRRRIAMTTDGGIQIVLDLPYSRLLLNGAGLELEDGRIVVVIAQVEPLIEVHAASAAELLRLAWHIGNRHLAAQIETDRILIRRDHVIADMLKGLGATVTALEASFDPEGGAYGGPHEDHHHHPHDHAHVPAADASS
jgi:urease accessory protein